MRLHLLTSARMQTANPIRIPAQQLRGLVWVHVVHLFSDPAPSLVPREDTHKQNPKTLRCHFTAFLAEPLCVIHVYSFRVMLCVPSDLGHAV